MATARELQDRDPDGSVNRSYYAMFDIARAALLSDGVREDELPRTHSGLIGSFSKHAVLSGRCVIQILWWAVPGIPGALALDVIVPFFKDF